MSARALPSDCEELARTVAHPSVVKGADAKVLVAKYAGALTLANGRIVDARHCFAQVRQALTK